MCVHPTVYPSVSTRIYIILYIVYPYGHIFMCTYKITFRYTRLPTPSLVHSLHTRSRKHACTPHFTYPFTYTQKHRHVSLYCLSIYLHIQKRGKRWGLRERGVRREGPSTRFSIPRRDLGGRDPDVRDLDHQRRRAV